MLPEISRVLWSCDGACTLPLYLLEVCVCACVPVWAAADRSWGTETDKAAGGCAGITFTSSRKTTVKKKTRAGWAKLEAGLSSNVWHVVLFKAESSRAGNHTAVGILCPAMITLVGGGWGQNWDALLWVRGQIPPSTKGGAFALPGIVGRVWSWVRKEGLKKSLKEGISCRQRWVTFVCQGHSCWVKSSNERSVMLRDAVF